MIVLVTSQRQNINLKNLTKNSFKKLKILLLLLTKQVLYKGGKFAPFPVQIGWENSPVEIGLKKPSCQVFPLSAKMLQKV